MTISITNGTSTVTVAQILGWDTSRASRNLVKDIVARGPKDITFGPLGLREGTITVLCNTLADAVALETYFGSKTLTTHTLADTEVPQVAMVFVIQGTVDTSLDMETAVATTVTFGFQEVVL